MKFVDLLKSTWKVYVDNPLISFESHFVDNIKHLKEVSISWSVKQKKHADKELVEIEQLLVDSFNKPGYGFLSEDDKTLLSSLESHRRKILLEREQEVRQKSRAIWLLCGDENNLFFS